MKIPLKLIKYIKITEIYFIFSITFYYNYIPSKYKNEIKFMTEKVKIIFLGDSSVGKSCIISALNNYSINSLHEPTIGIDFYTKCCERGDREYKLQFWDTAGQQKFRSIMPSYVRNSHFVIIVYDVTNSKSYSNLDKWFQFLGTCSAPETKKFVLGNKIDLVQERITEKEEIEEMMKFRETKYRQISAKTREGVDDFLEEILSELDEMNMEENSKKASRSMQLKSTKNFELLKQKCCQQ